MNQKQCHFLKDSGQKKNPESIVSSVMDSCTHLIACLGHMLSKITQEAPTQLNKRSSFNCKTKPKIGLTDYLKRIHTFAGSSPYVYIKAMIYMDRFQSQSQEFILNAFTVHRQLICAIMIATKYSQDFYYTNRHYSKVGGISEDQINTMQRQFLQTIQYRLFVKSEQLSQYKQKLETYYEIMMIPDQEKVNLGTLSERPLTNSLQS